MHRFYSCIFFVIIIFFQACELTNNKITPPQIQKPAPPALTLEQVLKNISDIFVGDWQKKQAQFQHDITALEQLVHPFSIEEPTEAKKIIDLTLFLRLANLNDKKTLDDIKKNKSFALNLIILIRSLKEITTIPDNYTKDIDLVHGILLVDPAIKLAYYRLLASKSNPKNILDIYARKSNFDLKIYATSPYDTPHDFVSAPIKWSIKSKLGDMQFTQYPALNQQIAPNDPPNYCGYYAIYNASILSSPSLFPHFGDRDAFRKFFAKKLEIIKKSRIDSSSTDLSEYDLLRLSQLEHIELFGLVGEEKIIKNLELDGDFLAGITDVNSGIIIPDIIKHFLNINMGNTNTDRQTFVGNTSAGGSHWFAFSLEKKGGVLIVNLVDSLGQNRQDLFQRWFPKG